MNNIRSVVAKEGLPADIEKIKDVKGPLEKVSISEVNEIAKESEKIILKPDLNVIKRSSLEALIEENRQVKELRVGNEFNEAKEDKEGLTVEEKEKLRELTGWSDEIIDNINSWEEAEIYMKANLKEVEINGKKCLIRDDIDPDQKDEDGISNRERMERGRPPITKNGEEVELHHIGQKQSSPLAELTTEEHRGVGNDSILHDKTKESEIDRTKFASERKEHWKNRCNEM